MVASAIKHKSVRVESRKLDLNVLKKLYMLNIIKNFKYSEFKINGNIELKAKLYFKKNSKIYLSKKQILKKKLHIFSTIYIFSTNMGLLTQHEMINKNIGGFLILKLVIY